MLDTLNTAVCQLYPNKTGEKSQKQQPSFSWGKAEAKSAGSRPPILLLTKAVMLSSLLWIEFPQSKDKCLEILL